MWKSESDLDSVTERTQRSVPFERLNGTSRRDLLGLIMLLIQSILTYSKTKKELILSFLYVNGCFTDVRYMDSGIIRLDHYYGTGHTVNDDGMLVPTMNQL